jgi:hypothetical protein
VLDPLVLGDASVTSVGRVYAVPSSLDTGAPLGLLGNDVFMRALTTISYRTSQLRFRALPVRPSVRTRGPDGRTCTGRDGQRVPCIAVALTSTTDKVAPEDLPGVCLQIDVDPSYQGKTLELAITAENDTERALFNGGAIRAFLTVGKSGVHTCFHVWKQFENLGVTTSTALSLRWVRTEGITWPCDPLATKCLSFTGPLAKLPVKG